MIKTQLVEIAALRALMIKGAAAKDRVIKDGVIKDSVIKVGTRIGVIRDRAVIGRRMIGNRGTRRA